MNSIFIVIHSCELQKICCYNNMSIFTVYLYNITGQQVVLFIIIIMLHNIVIIQSNYIYIYTTDSCIETYSSIIIYCN